ncbi:MAG: hypothetical protein R2737_16300 [Candidatus Nanopelagicales bacterium]
MGAGAQLGQLVLGQHQPVQDRPRVLEQQRTGRGDLDRPRAARPVEHRLSDRPLQPGDLLADRRLGEAQPRAGAAERPLLGDGPQREQVTDLEVPDAGHVDKTSR